MTLPPFFHLLHLIPLFSSPANAAGCKLLTAMKYSPGEPRRLQICNSRIIQPMNIAHQLFFSIQISLFQPPKVDRSMTGSITHFTSPCNFCLTLSVSSYFFSLKSSIPEKKRQSSRIWLEKWSQKKQPKFEKSLVVNPWLKFFIYFMV